VISSTRGPATAAERPFGASPTASLVTETDTHKAARLVRLADRSQLTVTAGPGLVVPQARAQLAAAVSVDFHAAHSALLSDGLSIAHGGSAQVSRFGLARSYLLSLL